MKLIFILALTVSFALAQEKKPADEKAGGKQKIALTDSFLLDAVQRLKDHYAPALAAAGSRTENGDNSWTTRELSFWKLLTAEMAVSMGPIYYVGFQIKELGCQGAGCILDCKYQIITCQATVWDRIGKPLGDGKVGNSTDLVDINCTKDDKEHDEFGDDDDDDDNNSNSPRGELRKKEMMKTVGSRC